MEFHKFFTIFNISFFIIILGLLAFIAFLQFGHSNILTGVVGLAVL
jgi:hypothetical protein